MGIHGDKPFAATVIGALGYLAGSIGYVAIPVIIVLAAARPSRATIADMMWPADRERRLAAAAFWAPFLLPALGALASGTEITSLWSMPAWTLLPVLLLSSPAVTIAAADTRRILIAARCAVPLVMLIAAPAIAIMVHRAGPRLPPRMRACWRRKSSAPGTRRRRSRCALSAAMPRSPMASSPTRPTARARCRTCRRRALPSWRASGMALVCFAEDFACRRTAAERALRVAGSRTIETEITRNYLGFARQAAALHDRDRAAAAAVSGARARFNTGLMIALERAFSGLMIALNGACGTPI